MAENEKFIEQVFSLFEEKQWTALSTVLSAHHPADIAEFISLVSDDDQQRVFALVEEELKPDVLAELEERVGEEILESLSNMEISDIVEEMNPDDAADVLGYLPKERSEEVLDLMEKEESEEVRELLQYDEDTAGGIMTTDYVAMPGNLTVTEAIERIAYLDEDEPFYYIYVVDQQNVCVGYIELWELLKKQERSKTLKEVVHEEFVVASVDMDQEECAHLMSKYDLSSMPVVDKDGGLVGRITVDDAIDVIEEEASEDIFRLAGSDDEELSYDSPLQACRARLPWLLITLVSGFVTSLLLKRFMINMEQVIVLSFFVPIVMAMGGNTGIQSSTLIIRGLAVGSLHGRNVFKLLTKEIATGAIMGLICGLIIGVWARYLVGATPGSELAFTPTFLALIVSVSLFSAMTFAAIFGAFVPIMLDKYNIDPAVASGPFVTASNDILALVIYYGVTLLLIGIF